MAPRRRLSAFVLLFVVGASLRLRGAAAEDVLCGGHFAENCAACPHGNGEEWCHGDCQWSFGQCVPKVGAIALQDSEGYGSSFIVSGILMMIFACVYNQKVIKGPPPLPKVDGTIFHPARRNLWDCFFYPDTCLYTTFCMPVVAGKNYYATDVCPFWPGCILTFIGTYSPLFLFNTCIRAYLSGKVQDKLEHEHNFCMDCIYAAFCFPCEVGRESLEVDAELGADITCCCKVQVTPRLVAEVKEMVNEVTQKPPSPWDRRCDGVRKYRMCGGEGH